MVGCHALAQEVPHADPVDTTSFARANPNDAMPYVIIDEKVCDSKTQTAVPHLAFPVKFDGAEKAIGFSGDGKHVFYFKSFGKTAWGQTRDTIVIRDLEKGEIVKEFVRFDREKRDDVLENFNIQKSAPIISPDQKKVAIYGHSSLFTIKYFKPEFGQAILIFDYDTESFEFFVPTYYTVGFTVIPAAYYVAPDGTESIRNPGENWKNNLLVEHSYVVFTPDSRKIIVRQSPFHLAIYDIATKKLERSINLLMVMEGCPSMIYTFEMTPDGYLRTNLKPSLFPKGSAKILEYVDWDINTGEAIHIQYEDETTP